MQTMCQPLRLFDHTLQ